jgi:hypothetical protein
MNKYYVLRRGAEFKVSYMDAASAELWQKAGWELGAHPFESQKEAQVALDRWKGATQWKDSQQS